jgi:phage I-like protein
VNFTALLDAPAKPTKRVQIAKLGDFSDGRYGEFSITADEVESWRKNLAKLPGGKAVIDFDHKSQRTPRDSRAAGWITGVHRDGEKVMADVDWTELGEGAIERREYQFFSPVYGDFADEHGDTHSDTLSAGALTNVPFLGSMPALALASEDAMEGALKQLEADDEQHTRLLATLTTTQRNNLSSSDFVFPSDRRYPIHDESHAKNALARVAQNGSPEEQAKVKAAVYKRYPSLKPSKKESDSRSPMEAKILEALGLDAEADDAKVLAAVEALKTPPEPEPATTKTLEAQAQEQGLKLMSTAEFGDLQSQAAAGAKAAGELAETKFETAFTRALERGKAVPAQKELTHKLYVVDPAETLKALDEGPQLVNVTPRGAPIEATADVATPPGVSPEGFQMDKAVKDRIKELGKNPNTDYVEVWQLVQAEQASGNGA